MGGSLHRTELARLEKPCHGEGGMEVRQIDYEPRPVSYSHRRVGRLATFVVLVLALSAAGYKATPTVWRRAKLLYWQHAAMSLDPPEHQLVYDDDPAHYQKLVQSDEFEELTGSFSRSTAIRLERTWYEFADLAFPPGAGSNATLFLHALRNSKGDSRLVELEGGIPRWVLDGPVPAGSRQSFSLWCRVMRPARMLSDPQELNMTPFAVQCDTYWPTDHLRWYAGHVDPSDPSHLTIDYELNGKSFILEGWLRDDDTVALKVRDLSHKR